MLESTILLVLALAAGTAGGLLVGRTRRRDQSRPHPAIAEDHASLARQLDEARAQAEVASKRRARALARLSHELRTPLNAILGFSELLLADDLEDAHRHKVALISESGKTMLRLLNDIHDITRLESGKFRLVQEATDLREELRHCAGIVEEAARSAGTSLCWKVADAFPAGVMLDRIRLREVMLGLMANAVKHAPGGKVELAAEIAGRRLEIHVRDNGCGIPTARQKTIFEPFYDRADLNHDAPPQAGLGLPIARQIISLMGGAIRLESEVGSGSTFTISLPLALADAASSASQTASSPPGLRVLVAEDNAVNQQLIMAMLERLGANATLVADGAEAIQAIKAGQDTAARFDLLLMDVQMPGIDGIEATRHLRKAGISAADLPIIALSADCFPEDVARCLDAGMQGHIAKPVRLSHLADMLEEHGSPMCPPVPAEPAAGKLDLRSQLFTSAEGLSALEDKYVQRKTYLFRTIELALHEDAAVADWPRLLNELHKIAGTAANFGDATLGQVASDLSHSMKATFEPAERQLLLAKALPDLKRAA